MSYDAIGTVVLLTAAIYWAVHRIEAKMDKAANQRLGLHQQLERIAAKQDTIINRTPIPPLR